ncbi:hypothetical protein LTR91_004355 [Friedmanniomyces endolithicus]|uniref:UDENN domain-containing protein n=1 Tax=Friedmanniomyces endolithicus TaxID=329885 RepID=A0AAN6QYX8_9PEZI|nr:hypothetical protein LTR57_007638 [Friedmanniomyces endolithicus]KAK0980188.1 hypothetical protein LTS01_012124 [Friedmanniomyces endolithicus]KAK1004278.1 hypothetical protein LTR91_004355 [Friedmanniomyces endolithicus]KAK1038754.1 hypothetical protein LTS16_011748 [Friedmanniomyces endolithicus]
MATVLSARPNTNSIGTTNSTTSRTLSTQHHTLSSNSDSTSAHSHAPYDHVPVRLPSHRHVSNSHINGNGIPSPMSRRRQRPIKSQYPANSTEKHVEYILVASFDIDRGSVMEHQYPGPVGGDEHMLAELMLPDQTHLRSQDWTIFFLHKDAAGEEDDEMKQRRRRRRRRRKKQGEDGQMKAGAEDREDVDGEDGQGEEDEIDGDDDNFDDSSDEETFDVPPLVYVLNLVNTKQDHTVKRGAVVKAMAVCTRHSFLHIYKPLLLLALEQYFANPVIETLAGLYNAVNAMDLSLMPRLNSYERFILQSSDAKDLFLEKFEAIIAQRMAGSNATPSNPALTAPSPTMNPSQRARYGLPRDTHELESVVPYAGIPIPVKVPTALLPETVGDFSLVKLITTFSTPHSTSPQPFTPRHPHLTTSGGLTHPIIVLLNALLTQKRIIFLGHNLPSSDVAEAVLGACALASGGVLRGFTRHAFPYTDLTKIDDLLKVPGFIAGVTNPAFAHKTEWWDLLCDLGTGRMRISNRIEAVSPIPEGVRFFQQPGHLPSAFSSSTTGSAAGTAVAGISALAAAGASLSAGLGGSGLMGTVISGDATGDVAFMAGVLRAIEERHGEGAVRRKFRRWVVKFTRLAAAFEEWVYGASMLVIAPTPPTTHPPPSPFVAEHTSPSPSTSSPKPNPNNAGPSPLSLPPEVLTHGYVFPTPQSKTNELAANATRIEGWRSTRSYYNFVQDTAASYPRRPVKSVDLQHLHDRLAKLRLTSEGSGAVYLAVCAVVRGEREVEELLAVVGGGVWGADGGVQGGALQAAAGGSGGGGGGGGQGQGLFYLGFGLFHPKVEVREAVAGLLGRVREHEAGRHFWVGVGRFVQGAWERVERAREARVRDAEEEAEEAAGG